MACLGSHPGPLEFVFQGLAALALLLLFHRQALGLLLQPRGIVPLPGNALATVEFQDPSCDVVEEVAVVRDGDDRALVLLQMGLEPLDTLGIEVVGRLVEKQHVGLLQQQAAESHAAAFSSGEILHQRIGRRALQGIHSPLELGIDLPAVVMLYQFGQLTLALNQRGHPVIIHRFHELQADFVVFGKQVHHLLYTFLHHFDDGFFGIHLRLLLKIADTVARGPYHLAAVALLHSCDNLEEGGFSGTVEADDTYLRPVEEREVDIFEDNLVVVRQDLAHPVHREYYLFVCHEGKDKE